MRYVGYQDSRSLHSFKEHFGEQELAPIAQPPCWLSHDAAHLYHFFFTRTVQTARILGASQ